MKKFQNILVALDLNKTLFFKSQSPLPILHDKKIKKIFVYFRPHLQQFIEYLHVNQINYCFWSNMMHKNCVKYIKQLQAIGMNKHCGIFDQQFCDMGQNFQQQEIKIKRIKNLHKLAALYQIDVDHCILVDDSKQKNLQGCNLIHVNSYLGEQVDKDLLNVIQMLKEFRNKRVNQQDKTLPMLQYKQYKYQRYLDNVAPPKKLQKIEEKKDQPSEIQKLIQNNAVLKRLKMDLMSQKQNRKNVIKEIQLLQKSNAEMAQQVKQKSQGKVVRKGDQLLLQVLMFAKNKKVSQKKLDQLKQKKKASQQKIAIIKKLIQIKIKQLNPKVIESKYDETKDETPSEACFETKNKKAKKSKKNNQHPDNQQSSDKQGEATKPQQVKQ